MIELIEDERRGVPSASGLERVALCPGSWALEQQCPPDEDSPYAAEGSMLHAVLAGEISDDGLTSDQQWIVSECQDTEARIVANLDMESASVEREQRLWYPDPAFSGKPDAIYIQGTKLLAVDYKTGRGAVPSAESNWQMRALAVLTAHHYGVTDVYVALIQPRGKEPLTICHYNERNLERAARSITNVIRKAMSAEAPRVPGDKQCRYCRAKMFCPEIRGEALSIVPVEAITTAVVELPTLTAEQLAVLLPKCELAEQVIKGVKAQAKQLLENGGEIDGYALQEGATRREIPDAQKAYAKLDDIVTPEEYAGVCTVGLGKLEKLYGEKAGLKGGALRAALAGRLGDAMIEKPPAAPSLVRTA